MSATTSASWLTSATNGLAPISPPAFSILVRSRPQIATRAPASASASAVAFPIPLDPPVTSTRALAMFIVILSPPLVGLIRHDSAAGRLRRAAYDIIVSLCDRRRRMHSRAGTIVAYSTRHAEEPI